MLRSFVTVTFIDIVIVYLVETVVKEHGKNKLGKESPRIGKRPLKALDYSLAWLGAVRLYELDIDIGPV